LQMLDSAGRLDDLKAPQANTQSESMISSGSALCGETAMHTMLK